MAKLIFLPSLYQVRVELSQEVCGATPLPPESIMERAKKKLVSLQDAGDIDFFELYEKELNDAWEFAGSNPIEAFTILIGAGCPIKSGIEVSKPIYANAICSISFLASPDVRRSWKLDWLTLYVDRQLAVMGQPGKVNPAQLHAAWLRSLRGEFVEDLSLGELPSKSATNDGKHAVFMGNIERKESLVIHDVAAMAQAYQADSLFHKIDKVTVLSRSNRRETHHSIEKYCAPPRSFIWGSRPATGFQPLGALVALKLPQSTDLDSKAQKAKDYPGRGALKVEVSQDGLSPPLLSSTLGCSRIVNLSRGKLAAFRG